MHTDIPLEPAALARAARQLGGLTETLTVTFGLGYFFGRQPHGNYPVPSLGRIQATVGRAILHPELLERTGAAKTAKQSC